MKHLASVLLAGTMMSGAAAFGSLAWAQPAPMVLAQAEVPPLPPGAAGDAPAEGEPKKRGEEKQQRKQERQEQKQQPRQEQRQEQKQQRQEERQQRREAPPAAPPVEKQAPPAPVEKLAPPPAARELPPVEKAPPAQREVPRPPREAPPVEKQAPPPVEKQAPPPAAVQPPAAPNAPEAPPVDRKQQRQLERQMEKNNGPTPPLPPVAPRTAPPAASDVAPPPAPAAPDAATPPGTPPVPGAAPSVPPADGKQAPPPAAETAPSAPSVAPAPPPAGEKPAIPPEELKGGKRTPEQRERANERADQEFKSRDRKNDERFGRKVEERGDRTIIREGDNRVIIREGDRTIIRSDENERLRRNSRDVREERRGNQTVTVIQRPDGSEIVTIKDADGNLIRRVRREGGREVVIIDNERAWERGGRWDRDRGWRDRDRGLHVDFYLDLPPVRVAIPREEYIVDADEASYEDFEEAFDAPPLVRTERPYSLQEVTQNVRLRERVRSIDLNSVTFPTGEWTLPPDQIPQLEDLARAIKASIDRDPSQVYLVEGHTDAVGSQIDNLSLSDRRAEEVAAILTENFQIASENLVTQGYGEDYLKVNTLSANEENRRVTIRNITQLLNAQQSQAAPQ